MKFEISVTIDDEEAGAHLKALLAALQQPAEAKAPRKGRKAKEPEAAPELPPVEVSAEDAAQQAQDEAEEREATRDAGVTEDDVRAAVVRLAEKIGMGQAIIELSKILGCSLKDLPKTEEAFADAIEKIDRFGLVETVVETLAPLTKKDLLAAIEAYRDAYDGHGVALRDAPHTAEDCIRLLKASTGCDTFPRVPEDPEIVGKAIKAIRAAVVDNPFKRARIGK